MHAGYDDGEVVLVVPADAVADWLVYVPLGQPVGAWDAAGQYDPAGHGVHCSTRDRVVRDEKVPAGHGNCVADDVDSGQ